MSIPYFQENLFDIIVMFIRIWRWEENDEKEIYVLGMIEDLYNVIKEADAVVNTEELPRSYIDRLSASFAITL